MVASWRNLAMQTLILGAATAALLLLPSAVQAPVLCFEITAFYGRMG